MTKEILNNIAKAHKINLSIYDHVYAAINDNYTKIRVYIYALEILPGGQRRWCGTQAFNLSVNAILKKEELLPEDYETNGERWIYELK